MWELGCWDDGIAWGQSRDLAARPHGHCWDLDPPVWQSVASVMNLFSLSMLQCLRYTVQNTDGSSRLEFAKQDGGGGGGRFICIVNLFGQVGFN
jgi:hypothetical protein